ncbi:MAG: bifunctional hydroxymethylpyrimidine kinase/phosphomethylpyrimidine kinase, partial [Gammaproteobacteria bacterium]|nr:bifunctional hydroxymethylpyrimidine kinase/phosphomethylpyrimidine kinase [Gammaproteobacteria bacterium]
MSDSRKKVNVLTIAGSDPSSGAGLQGDLQTILAFGATPFSVVTAVTSQNTKEMKG